MDHSDNDSVGDGPSGAINGQHKSTDDGMPENLSTIVSAGIKDVIEKSIKIVSDETNAKIGKETVRTALSEDSLLIESIELFPDRYPKKHANISDNLRVGLSTDRDPPTAPREGPEPEPSIHDQPSHHRGSFIDRLRTLSQQLKLGKAMQSGQSSTAPFLPRTSVPSLSGDAPRHPPCSIEVEDSQEDIPVFQAHSNDGAKHRPQGNVHVERLRKVIACLADSLWRCFGGDPGLEPEQAYTKQPRLAFSELSADESQSVVAPEAEDNSTLFDSPSSDGQRPNFDLSFCMQPLDDQLENGGDGSRAAEGMQPVIDAIYIDHNGTVAIPKPNSAGSVIDLPISVPANPLADVTNTNRINPGDPGQNVTQNIMTHAAFRGCTITFQMKQT